ncbi:hypothetical protein P154DRAFT_617564 [Amniculicola lignicola CBS 123094]|uniref:Uncharacterized protein n=1 Tax=Amniculicola lignicola CBS 123094 TaxID=1392246 RepID=A0A6A5WP10_9PLEO|nr:hypothetical protein P154DRAFT_617564 [Amniculicola lignicola CBS 123094]
MAAHPVPNVWTQMNYVPPRGQCNFKTSIVSPKCPCLRFMLHPLKSSSSYECDGCGHHASFHNMENKVEDEIRRKWEQEAKEKEQERVVARPKKRLRELEFNGATAGGMRLLEESSAVEEMDSSSVQTVAASGSSKTKAKKGGAKGKQAALRGAGSRARGKVIELDGDDDEYLELD